MKKSLPQTTVLSGNRRSFLKSAGVLAMVAPAAMALPDTAEWWHGHGRLLLEASGVVPPNCVVPPLYETPEQGAELFKFLQELTGFNVPVALLTVQFPLRHARDILAVRVDLIEAAPVPAPPAPFPYSHFDIRVNHVQLGWTPEKPPGAKRCPTFELAGRVVAMSQEGPYGNLLGCAASVSGAWLGDGKFSLLAAAVAGSHSSTALEAQGRWGQK